jgi:hypothetical protein
MILELWTNGDIPELAALAAPFAAGVTVLGVIMMWLSRRTGDITT